VPCGSRVGVPWYCYIAKHQQEVTADTHLRQQGFTSYLPQHEVAWKNRQRKIAPLFPRYGFVQLDVDSDHWGAVYWTRGVESLIADPDNRRPIRVPTRAVDLLLAQCAPNGVIYPNAPIDDLMVGDMVRVTDGPMAGLIGVCHRRSSDRITLLMDIMGRPVEVATQRASVEVI